MIIVRTLMLGAALAITPGIAYAQAEPDRRPAGQIADSADIATHARQLVRGAASDSARHAAIYEWVARNVRYDAPTFFRGGKGYEDAESVWRHRTALCGGFVALYARLAHEVGLTAEPVEGYAKGVDYTFGQSTRKSNHAWLAVRLNGRWRLVDPTWGAGVIAGRSFEPRFTWDFFLVEPEALILSHFPEEARWQLLGAPMARRDFERMRAVPRTLLTVGFSPGSIRAVALAGARDFPLVGPPVTPVRVLAAPVAGTVPAARPAAFEVEWPGATDVALVTGDAEWTKLVRSGERFRGEVVPAGSALYLVGRTGASAEYHTLLHYRVESAGRGGAAPR